MSAELMKLAHKAGFPVLLAYEKQSLAKFAILIRQQERERCADFAESWLNTVTNATMASDCAAAIRALED